MAQKDSKRTGAVLFFAGIAAGLVFWSYYRVVTTKFPLDFISPVYVTIMLCGLVPGALSGWRVQSPQVGRMVAWAGGLIVFMIGALLYKDQSLHYLLFAQYYDYPAPNEYGSSVGLLLSTLLSPLPFFVFARRAATTVRNSPGRLPLVLAGVALGLLVAEPAIPQWGAYAVLIVGTAATCMLLGDIRVALASALVALVAGALLHNPPPALYTWQLEDYTYLDGYWTRMYKVDFIEFDNGNCLGSLRNEIMIEYSCNDAEKIPMTHTEMTKVLADGPIPKRRILTISRPSGVIPLAHRTYNPNLTRAVSVESDTRIASDIVHKYGDQTGHIWAEPEFIELVNADNRIYLEETGEKFDITYIDGIGLMLVPFPLTVIQYENFVFSSDSYRRILDELMGPDGVLVIDRGTTATDEANDLGGPLPADVKVRALFTKIPNYPFTGLSLVFVLASRNEAELDRVAAELKRGGMYATSRFDEERRPKHWIDDDRPFFQPAAIGGMYVLMFPFTLLFGFWSMRRVRRIRAAPSWRQKIPAYLLGVAMASAFVLVTLYGARAFHLGPQTGFVRCAAVFFIVAACAMWMARKLVPAHAAIGAAVSWALGLALVLFLPLQLVAAYAGAALVGLGFGLLLSVARPEPDDLPPGYILLCGAVFGILAFQWLFFALGVQGAAAVLSLMALLSLVVTPSPAAASPDY